MHILRLLGPKEAAKLSVVCKALRSLVSDNRLWIHFLQTHQAEPSGDSVFFAETTLSYGYPLPWVLVFFLRHSFMGSNFVPWSVLNLVVGCAWKFVSWWMLLVNLVDCDWQIVFWWVLLVNLVDCGWKFVFLWVVLVFAVMGHAHGLIVACEFDGLCVDRYWNSVFWWLVKVVIGVVVTQIFYLHLWIWWIILPVIGILCFGGWCASDSNFVLWSVLHVNMMDYVASDWNFVFWWVVQVMCVSFCYDGSDVLVMIGGFSYGWCCSFLVLCALLFFMGRVSDCYFVLWMVVQVNLMDCID